MGRHDEIKKSLAEGVREDEPERWRYAMVGSLQ
jgi:hypothetical protein